MKGLKTTATFFFIACLCLVAAIAVASQPRTLGPTDLDSTSSIQKNPGYRVGETLTFSYTLTNYTYGPFYPQFALPPSLSFVENGCSVLELGTMERPATCEIKLKFTAGFKDIGAYNGQILVDNESLRQPIAASVPIQVLAYYIYLTGPGGYASCKMDEFGVIKEGSCIDEPFTEAVFPFSLYRNYVLGEDIYTFIFMQSPFDSYLVINNSSNTPLTADAFAGATAMTIQKFKGITYGYLTDRNNHLRKCSGSQLDTCENIHLTSPNDFLTSNNVEFQTFGDITYMYVADGTSKINRCQMDSSGNIINKGCSALTMTSPLAFTSTQSIAFKKFGTTTYAYVADHSSQVWRCKMDENGEIASAGCSALSAGTAASFDKTSYITIEEFSDNQHAYITDTSNQLWHCEMDGQGSFESDCKAVALSASKASLTGVHFSTQGFVDF